MTTDNEETTPVEYNKQLDTSANTNYNRMLAVRHVAKLLGIHENTVRMWADSGILESYRIGPRQDRRIPAEAVERTLEAAKQRGYRLPPIRK